MALFGLDIHLETLNDMTNAVINPFTETVFNFKFQYSAVLLIIIPLLIILFFMIKKNFVKIEEIHMTRRFKRNRAVFKLLIFISRLAIFALLLTVLAVPFGEVEKETQGNLKLTILVDNSTSMELFDTSFIDSLKQAVDQKIPTTVRYIGSGLDSRIGEGILSNLEKDGNILLISDGQATAGTDLFDVSLFAASMNATINAIELQNIKTDAGISITGPSKTTADTETKYYVKISRAGEIDKVKVKVTVDGKTIVEKETIEDEVSFSKNYSSGYHKITAEITNADQFNDYFAENNVFYKTTNVIKKPRILFVTKESNHLSSILNELYAVDELDYIPDSKKELDKYYAIILNDMAEKEIGSINNLREYVIEGNGLFVIGGYNSFDNGNYKDTPIETILPVNIGAAARKPGGANIVLVIDISGSTGSTSDSSGKSVDIEKSLALSVINDINEGNQVGAVAFNDQAYLVADIDPLYVNKAELENKISRLIDGGPTTLFAGMSGAYEVMKGRSGSRNIIFISDGYTLDKVDLQSTQDLVKQMYAEGINLFIIGVGRNVNSAYLNQLGNLGGGFYLEATDKDRLKIIFGEPEHKDVGQAFDLFLLNRNHFITKDLELDAVLYGYNQVIPKSNARLLVTTDSGEPAVTVGRYGIGRVATLTVFSSGNNLGELLNIKNSVLLTRVTNWVIADPERKEPYFVSISDSRINKESEVLVKSDKIPVAEGLDFRKTSENTFLAFLENKEIGFQELLTATYAVNYNKEYEKLSINPGLNTAVQATGGKIFKPEETDSIVEHTVTVSKRKIVEKTRFQIPLIIIALVILLIDICARRVYQTWFK